MGQKFMKHKTNIAIVGAGPAGCMCAYEAQKKFQVTIFEANEPLKSLLYTGGGRCNFAYAEFNFKELAKYYPRGEKFLLSVFSKFDANDSISFMENIGLKVYSQDDRRMFPKSNSAKDVREHILDSIIDCEIKKEMVKSIKFQNNSFLINNKYKFDNVVIAIGGHAGFSLAKSLGHNIIEPKPSLLGLITKDNYTNLQGVTIHDIKAKIKLDGVNLPKIKTNLQGDLLFTHNGISGPLAYMISSICARYDYNSTNPIIVKLKLLDDDVNFQQILNNNRKKQKKNIVSAFVPT